MQPLLVKLELPTFLHDTRAGSSIEPSISIRMSSERSLKVRVNLGPVVELAIMRKLDYKLPDAREYGCRHTAEGISGL